MRTVTGHQRADAPAADARSILAWLRERTDEMVELLGRLVEAESPSLEPEAHGPVVGLLERELTRAGLAVERIAGSGTGDHLLATDPKAGSGSGHQLVLGHLDTVWPRGTIDEMPVRLEDGLLYGPGAFDMKGGLAQMIFALRAIGEAGVTPPLPLVVLVNADEELGSPDSRVTVAQLARQAERVFVCEPAFGPSGKLKTARKGVARFTLRVTGSASHAGLDPDAGASAILEISHQIQRLFELNDAERGTTVNVGMIDGGLRPNVVAPRCRAEIEARVVSAEDAERIEREIRALEPVTEGVSVEVEGGFGRPPLEPNPRNRRLWRLALEAAAQLGLRIEEAHVGGASDANLTSSYAPTLDGLGAVGDGAHAPHEHVVVDRMPERAALLALLLAARVEGWAER